MTAIVVPSRETDRLIVLTDKGQAVRIAYHFLAAIRRLDAEERADVLELLEDEFARDAV